MAYGENSLGKAPQHQRTALRLAAEKISTAQISGSGGYKTQMRAEIIEAWKFLKEKNMNLPTMVIDFMRDSALDALEENEGEIYVVEAETGQRDDREKHIVFAGGNKKKAMKVSSGAGVVFPEGTHTIYITLYRNGVKVSQIMRSSGLKWEWNLSGDKQAEAELSSWFD